MADSYKRAMICHLLFYSAIVVPFSMNKCGVYGARQEPKNQYKEIKSLIPSSTYFTSTKGKFQDMKIVDRDASCTPPSTTKSLHNSHQEKLGDGSLKPLKLERNLGEFGEDIILTLTTKDDINFLVTAGFGTPNQDFTLLFDSGSELTWIPCNTQNSFNPSLSSTFSNNATCHTPNCDYASYYNDGSSSTGHYVKDTLTIHSNPIPDFTFGCAQNITGDFGGGSGVLGVGRGMYSLLTQTDPSFFSDFCYCLPPSKSSSGYIVFGVQAFETCQPDSKNLVSIIPGPNNRALTSYYVTLVGITIGPKRLDIASYTPSPSLNVIIDSGTVISRLPPSLYSGLRSAFEEIMKIYPKTTSSDPLFDTCYNIEGHSNWTPPNMVLHFEGNVDVNLDSSAATTTGKNDSEVCLAFAATEDANDLNIIGNQQHRALNIFFDTGGGKLGFNTDGCNNIISD